MDHKMPGWEYRVQRIQACITTGILQDSIKTLLKLEDFTFIQAQARGHIQSLLDKRDQRAVVLSNCLGWDTGV